MSYHDSQRQKERREEDERTYVANIGELSRMLQSLVISGGLNLMGSRVSEASRSWNDGDGVNGTVNSRLRPSNCCLPELDVDHMGISPILLFKLSTKDVLIVSLALGLVVVCVCPSLSSEGSFGKGRSKSEKVFRLSPFMWSIVTSE